MCVRRLLHALRLLLLPFIDDQFNCLKYDEADSDGDVGVWADMDAQGSESARDRGAGRWSGQGGGVLVYSVVVEFNAGNNATVVFNKATVSTYSYAGTNWVGYDDVTSIAAKVKFAKAQGLGGYFFWALGDDNNWTLAKTEGAEVLAVDEPLPYAVGMKLVAAIQTTHRSSVQIVTSTYRRVVISLASSKAFENWPPLSAPLMLSRSTPSTTLNTESNPSGNFSCVTGDYGSGKVECAVAAAIPVTLAEFALDSFNGMDVYDLSLVKGYNLSILVAPAQIAARRSAITMLTNL
ncbi:hypothetical protein SASPL_108627 [Salvia splendens]|uniref:GH18 domain-containing protein n=1 Tax=Salvia splendens TaxID=180675 RepID=A0A8X9A6D6_SALSN|nr:hypothetical protein SASPL_108627 [Salvia splendens]